MAPEHEDLHPDARSVINVEIETSTVLREPQIDVIFSGPVLVVSLHSTELTKSCRVTASGAEAIRVSFKKKTVPPGSLISLTAYSEREVHVETVLTTGYTVH